MNISSYNKNINTLKTLPWHRKHKIKKQDGNNASPWRADGVESLHEEQVTNQGRRMAPTPLTASTTGLPRDRLLYPSMPATLVNGSLSIVDEHIDAYAADMYARRGVACTTSTLTDMKKLAPPAGGRAKKNHSKGENKKGTPIYSTTTLRTAGPRANQHNTPLPERAGVAGAHEHMQCVWMHMCIRKARTSASPPVSTGGARAQP